MSISRTTTQTAPALSPASAPSSHATSRTLAALIASAALASIASAQASSSYSVTHTFTYTPAGDVVDVRALRFEHVWLVVDNIPAEDHRPLAQDPNFEPFGTDSFLPSGLAENSGFGAPVPVSYQVLNIPSSGTNNPITQCANVIVPPSHATACTTIDILPFTALPGTFQIDGKINSTGDVMADVIGRGSADAYAFSNVAIEVQGGNLMGNGQIQWSPNIFFNSVGGTTASSFVQDPIVMEVSNLTTGTSTTIDLLHIDANIIGEGFIEWDPSGITCQAKIATLKSDLGALRVPPSQRGKLEIIIQNSVVTSSTGTGIFAASAPPVGTPVPFTVPAPAIQLDYDLAFDPANDYAVRATLAGGGSASVFFAPCPADINGDGFLDNGDIIAFINLFLSGSSAADFNGDGFLDNGDIGDFINAFIEGC